MDDPTAAAQLAGVGLTGSSEVETRLRAKVESLQQPAQFTVPQQLATDTSGHTGKQHPVVP